MKRPGPWLWLRYAYGAALPERYREWVLHDVTAPTWILRHVLRGVVQFLPFAIVLLLVIPVDKGILATGIAMGALIGLLFSTAFVDNVAESRAMKGGLPGGPRRAGPAGAGQEGPSPSPPAALTAQDAIHHTARPPNRAIGRLRFRCRHASQAAAAASSAGAVSAKAIVPCGATNAGTTMAASTAGPTYGSSLATRAGGARWAMTRKAARIA